MTLDRRLGLSLTLSLAACAPADGPARTRAAQGADTLGIRAPVVVRDVRVFDGERVVPRATVVLAGGRVVRVALPGEPAEAPDGAVEVDGAGKTLLPGLIDAHTHTFDRNYLKTAAAFGVTAHLDMFTDLEFLMLAKQEQRSGRSADRPDLFSAGTLVTAAGGHGTQYGPVPTLEDPADAQAFVDAQLAVGADYVKIVLEDGAAFGMSRPTLDGARVSAVIEAARARGAKVLAHVGSRAHARLAIEAGVDGLMHVFGDGAPDPDFGHFAAGHGIFVVPTLSVQEGLEGRGPAGAALVEDPVIGARLMPQLRDNLMTAFPAPEDAPFAMEHAHAATRLLHEAGVPILVGSDGPNPGTALGPTVHREMELLVMEVGMTPVETLRAATSATARAFGLEAWRGRIVEGGRADVVLVEGDPTTDILDTRRVVAIWKEGRRWKLELYLAEVEAARAGAG